MNTKFIYWFAYYNLDSPSVRYRAKYPLDFLKSHKGVESYLVTPSYSFVGILLFLKAYFGALFFRKKDSLIIIQRVQSNFIYANLLKFLVRIRNKNTIYDLDDADYLEVDPKTIYFFAKNCEKISAGSRAIARYMSQFNDNIVHTTSPIVDLEIVKTNRNPIFTIGWIGGFGGEHKESLIELVFPALYELSFDFKFVIIGVIKPEDRTFIYNFFQDKSNIEIEIPVEIDWNNELDIQERIALFDLGIATLTSSELQLCKSGIKAKQYMNNGVPVLSNNLPENNAVVVDGHNGFFCDTIADYKERLTQFKNMSDSDYFWYSENARQSIVHFDHTRYLESFEA